MRTMKDSGIEWIGQIPDNKYIIRNKYLIKYTKGKIPNNTNTDGKGLPYVGASDLENISGNCNYNVYTEDTAIPMCNRDDVLILWDGARAGLIGTNHTGALSSTVVNVAPISLISTRFWYWYLKGFEKYLYECVNGTTIPHMNKSFIEDICFIDWSLSEQSRIADYLDDKCGKIDRYIEKQQQIIEKLKEYKQAVITETTVPKKGWSKCHLGYIASFKNGLNYNGLATDCEIRFLGVGDFKDNFMLSKENDFSTLKFDGTMPEDLLLQDNDIVFVRSNGSKELVGRSVILKNINFQLTYSGFCIRMRNHRKDILSNEYLMYCFWSTAFRQYLNRDSRGSNINNLNQELLSKYTIHFPDISEQYKIAEYLSKKITDIDETVKQYESLIQKAIEYKKSLIYEAVTGKMEV